MTNHLSPLGEATSRMSTMHREKAMVWGLMLAVGILHCAMLVYDLFHPDVFFHADRALQRFPHMMGYLEVLQRGQGVADFLARHGNIGDYWVHAMIFRGVGQYGILVVQILLQIGSVYSVLCIARMAGAGRLVAVGAAGAYAILPHSLILPHTLTSEALFIPGLIFSTHALFKFVESGRFRFAVLSGALLGVATLIRPLTLLWPLAVAPVLLLAMPRGVSKVLGYLLISYVPVALWMGFIWTQIGQFSMGPSDHQMGNNMWQRVWRIAETLPATERDAIVVKYLQGGRPGSVELRRYAGSIDVVNYARFVGEYPLPALKHTTRDAAVFVGKSGVERIFLDYLATSDDDKKVRRDIQKTWRGRWERDGMANTLLYLVKNDPWLVFAAVIGSVVFTTLVILSIATACVTLVRTLRAGKLVSSDAVIIILAGLPLYTFLVSQGLAAPESRHRAPAEFALCVLAALAVQSLDRRRQIIVGRRAAVHGGTL